ncbi:Hypothetical_protein [Hexamita inflata]|uniref:Hypothetical_protein n=1 Tax=Hexamita inflata TaxID=28002 RepID=A0AA86QT92_9EUKA|nr:Hypothetical protein HINF_LOCUS47992 [Hexamita inflata]
MSKNNKINNSFHLEIEPIAYLNYQNIGTPKTGDQNDYDEVINIKRYQSSGTFLKLSDKLEEQQIYRPHAVYKTMKMYSGPILYKEQNDYQNQIMEQQKKNIEESKQQENVEVMYQNQKESMYQKLKQFNNKKQVYQAKWRK